MNRELRCKMLNNRFAGSALDKLKKFYEAGISMNAQIVLCKGINDGEELDNPQIPFQFQAPTPPRSVCGQAG